MLSFWQIERGKEKSEIYENFAQSLKQKEIKIENLDTNFNNFTKVEILGKFLNKPQFLLDNVVVNRKPGFEIITPFKVKDKIILVNRGWVDNNYRQIVPNIDIINQTQSIVGYIYYYNKTYELSSDTYTQDDILIIQNIDFDSIEKLLNQTVMPYILMMNENQNNSYIRKKVYKKNPELKHYMYAGQWFLFSIIALIFAFKLLKRNKDE
tara:strand:+ start:25141 stop:25767 length:627 start_codon:yes stop_codon:yes gene_type:complete